MPGCNEVIGLLCNGEIYPLFDSHCGGVIGLSGIGEIGSLFDIGEVIVVSWLVPNGLVGLLSGDVLCNDEIALLFGSDAMIVVRLLGFLVMLRWIFYDSVEVIVVWSWVCLIVVKSFVCLVMVRYILCLVVMSLLW